MKMSVHRVSASLLQADGHVQMTVRARREEPEGESHLWSAALLRNTVGQFEKVIEFERNLLRNSVRKLERDLDGVLDELVSKEDELIVWEERLQQIQQDNETKLRRGASVV